MKALSIRQPWIWAILHAGKRLENRQDWSGCAFRGTILLHASKGGTLQEWRDEVDDVLDAARVTGHALPERPLTLRMLKEQSGGIVGKARIDGVIRSEADFAAYAANVPGGDKQRVWWAGGFALVLTEVEPLPFVPWKGSLGLFDVDDVSARKMLLGLAAHA